MMNKKVGIVIICILLVVLIVALVLGRRDSGVNLLTEQQQSSFDESPAITDDVGAETSFAESEANHSEICAAETSIDENEQQSSTESTGMNEAIDEQTGDNGVITIPDDMEIGGF